MTPVMSLLELNGYNFLLNITTEYFYYIQLHKYKIQIQLHASIKKNKIKKKSPLCLRKPNAPTRIWIVCDEVFDCINIFSITTFPGVAQWCSG